MPEPTTILVVDDEEPIRNLIVNILSKHLAHRILQAKNGLEAYRIFEEDQTSIALVLTDIVMPGMDGVQLAIKVRMARPDVPVLMMSGFSPTEMGVEDTNQRYFISKPFHQADLVMKVREALAACCATKHSSASQM